MSDEERETRAPEGRPLDAANARKVLGRILRRARVAERDEAGRIAVDLHSLRTTYGTRMARAGTPPQVLQALMGHHDVRVTMKHHVHLHVRDLTSAVDSAAELPAETGTAAGQQYEADTGA